jgi:hypothetical protein
MYKLSYLPGFWILCIVRYSKEHDVSETWSISASGEARAVLGPLERINLNHWFRCFPPLHLRTATDNVFETSCSLEYRTMDNPQTK